MHGNCMATHYVPYSQGVAINVATYYDVWQLCMLAI